MDGENKMEQYFFTVSTLDVLLVSAATQLVGPRKAVFVACIQPPIISSCSAFNGCLHTLVPTCQEGSFLGVTSTYPLEQKENARRTRLADTS